MTEAHDAVIAVDSAVEADTKNLYTLILKARLGGLFGGIYIIYCYIIGYGSMSDVWK